MEKKIAYLFFFIFIFSLFLLGCYEEKIDFSPDPTFDLELPLILKLDSKECFLDEQTNTLRYSISESNLNSFQPLTEFNDNNELFFNGTKLKNNSINEFGRIKIDSSYNLLIKTGKKESSFKLSFTNLATVRIVSGSQIYDEPKIVSNFSLNIPNQDTKISSYIGIEQRGGGSLFNPKKSYGFNFLEHPYLEDVKPVSINNKKNVEWILDAVYQDRSEIRNSLAFEVWSTFKNNNTRYINTFPVEVFINNRHEGFYSFNEKINPSFFNLSPDDVLYKAIGWELTTFRGTYYNPNDFSSNWGSWEQKYPVADHKTSWNQLDELTKLVMLSDTATFKKEIHNHIDIDNIIDYYIFINAILAVDNYGKNLFISNTENDKLYITPWDLDASFGRDFNSEIINPRSILTNNLFQRLINTNPNGFKTKLKNRWHSLKNDQLSITKVVSTIEHQINTIQTSGVMKFDTNRWDQNYDLLREMEFMNDWYNKRYLFVDSFLNNI